MIFKKRETVLVDELNDMQRYLGEETIDDYAAGQMSRRRMLRRLILICGSSAGAAALLAACGDPTATAVPATTAPATTTSATTAAATTAAPTTAAATTAAATTTAAPTTSAATTAAQTTAAGTTAAGTTAAGTTAAGTTAAAAPTPGQAKGPLVVPADDPAVTSSSVTFQGDTTILGYLAKPAAAGTYPGVIVIHENRGLTDHIKDVARRVAKAGYIALAVDLASRNGGTDKISSDQVTGYFANAKPEDLVKDLRAGVDFLGKQTGVKAADKLGVVGFCYGGGMTLRLAASEPKIAAAVSYYGPVFQPISQMAATNAAILGQYGGLDTRVNSGIPDLEKTLKDAGKTYEKKVYDGANHAFNNDTGASFNEAAAVAAWKETLAWFSKYL